MQLRCLSEELLQALPSVISVTIPVGCLREWWIYTLPPAPEDKNFAKKLLRGARRPASHSCSVFFFPRMESGSTPLPVYAHLHKC